MVLPPGIEPGSIGYQPIAATIELQKGYMVDLRGVEPRLYGGDTRIRTELNIFIASEATTPSSPYPR